MTISPPPDVHRFQFLPAREMAIPRTEQDDPFRLIAAAGTLVWRYRYWLAGWMALCIVVAAVVARTTPPTFTTSATILLDPRRPPTVGREPAAVPVLDLNRADTELQIVRSERLLRDVFDGLNLADTDDFKPRPPLIRMPFGGQGRTDAVPDPATARQRAFAEFTRRVSARRIGQTYTLEVAYSSGSATLSAKVANAIAAAYLLQSVTRKLEAARAGSEWAQARIDNLAAQVAAGDAALRDGRAPAVPMPDADGRLIGEALVPLSPSAPRPTLIVATGAVIGGMTAFCFLIAVGLFDRRLHNPAAVTASTGLPCIATVPRMRVRGWTGPLLKADIDNLVEGQPSGDLARALSSLRAAVRVAARPGTGGAGEVIALVSWTRGTGCSFLSMNLARLTHLTGRRVTVIETDVDDARQSVTSPTSGGLGSLVGLLSYRVPEPELRFEDNRGVLRLPAWLPEDGPTVVDFDSAPLAALIDDRRQRGDVLLDLAPLGDAAVSATIARRATAVVIVAAASVTTIDDVRSAARLLADAGANVVGVLLNHA